MGLIYGRWCGTQNGAAFLGPVSQGDFYCDHFWLRKKIYHKTVANFSAGKNVVTGGEPRAA